MTNDTAKATGAKAPSKPEAGSNGNGGPELSAAAQLAALEAEAEAIQAELAKRQTAAQAIRDAEARRVMGERMSAIKAACLVTIAAIDSTEGSVADMVGAVLKSVTEARSLTDAIARDTKVKGARSTGSGSGSGFTPTDAPRGDVWEAMIEAGPRIATLAATKGLGLTVGEWTEALRDGMGKPNLSSGHVGNTLSNMVHNSGRTFTVNGVEIKVEAFESGNGTRRVAWGAPTERPASETPDLGPSKPEDKAEGNSK